MCNDLIVLSTASILKQLLMEAAAVTRHGLHSAQGQDVDVNGRVMLTRGICAQMTTVPT